MFKLGDSSGYKENNKLSSGRCMFHYRSALLSQDYDYLAAMG